MAAGYGVTMSPHWFHDLHVHLVASAPNGRYVEFFPDDQALNFRKLINRQRERKTVTYFCRNFLASASNLTKEP